MKIAIDARWIFPEISGIGAYTRELIAQLALLDSKNEYVILFSDQAILGRTVAEDLELQKPAPAARRLGRPAGESRLPPPPDPE